MDEFDALILGEERAAENGRNTAFAHFRAEDLPRTGSEDGFDFGAEFGYYHRLSSLIGSPLGLRIAADAERLLKQAPSDNTEEKASLRARFAQLLRRNGIEHTSPSTDLF